MIKTDWKQRRATALKALGRTKDAALALGIDASTVTNMAKATPSAFEKLLLLTLDEQGTPEEKISAAAARLQALRGDSKQRAAIAKLRAILKSLR